VRKQQAVKQDQGFRAGTRFDDVEAGVVQGLLRQAVYSGSALASPIKLSRQ
jgi:hypothetical protein